MSRTSKTSIIPQTLVDKMASLRALKNFADHPDAAFPGVYGYDDARWSHLDDSDLHRHLTASMHSFSDTYALLSESLSLAANRPKLLKPAANRPKPLKPADIRDFDKAFTAILKAIARRLDANPAIVH